MCKIAAIDFLNPPTFGVWKMILKASTSAPASAAAGALTPASAAATAVLSPASVVGAIDVGVAGASSRAATDADTSAPAAAADTAAARLNLLPITPMAYFELCRMGTVADRVPRRDVCLPVGDQDVVLYEEEKP